ncbi:outer membrane lipoprotein chaperone LolA [uncultured Endozoicomonas sp.]|uniref:outer membrane lipoprotein chaperone LolA n=1 Tax=uncultured Endozoicomonas sp. TaxID=432652 RepID=UPI00260324F5|nr:outer membrane lipoprotein chaperone LolA [uncultured Endozoicomonas sp.]
MKKRQLLALLPMMLALGLPVSAEQKAPGDTPARVANDTQAANDLANKLQGMDTVSASFTQSTIDKHGRPKVEKGDMQLKRPNQFRWNITAPFSQEIVVRDGKLWMLDPDFKQVVIKKQDDQSGPTAVQLLSGNASVFLKGYSVIRMNYGPEEVFTLKPLRSEDLFEKLEINFSEGEISAITILDTLGGKRRIDFTGVTLNQPVNNELFQPDIKKLENDGFDIIDESNL